MASEKAWWIGIGSGIAVLVGTGATLVVRGLRKRKKITQPGTTQPGIEPPEGSSAPIPEPTPPPPPPRGDFGLTAPDVSGEICRQWKTGNHRPNWRPALTSVIRSAVERQIELRDPQWTTLAQLRLETFLVAREALAQVCPAVPLPKNAADVQRLGTDAGGGGFYWTELWQKFYDIAYALISGLGQ
jgi:hypothetical protein